MEEWGVEAWWGRVRRRPIRERARAALRLAAAGAILYLVLIPVALALQLAGIHDVPILGWPFSHPVLFGVAVLVVWLWWPNIRDWLRTLPRNRL